MHARLLIGFILIASSGCSSQNAEQQSTEAIGAPSVTQDLDRYSQSIVRATDNNISNPSRAQKTGDSPTLSYVIKFHTSDPALMSKVDGDTNRESYAFNLALNKGWNARFCTPELKAIMVEHDVFLVSGHLLDASGKMQTFVPCML